MGFDIPDFALTFYSASELYTSSSDSKPAFSPGVAFPVRYYTGVVFELFFEVTCFCPLARVGIGDFFDCIFFAVLATFELEVAFCFYIYLPFPDFTSGDYASNSSL